MPPIEALLPHRDLGAVSAGRRLLRPDDLRTPGGAAVSFSVSAPTGPNPQSRSFARICAIGESARDRGTGRCKTTAAVVLGIKITACPAGGMGRDRDRHRNCAIAKPSTIRRREHPSIACIAERNRGAASARRNVLGAAQGSALVESRRPATGRSGGHGHLDGCAHCRPRGGKKKKPKGDEQGAHQLKRLAVGMSEPATQGVSC